MKRDYHHYSYYDNSRSFNFTIMNKLYTHPTHLEMKETIVIV